MPSGHWKDSLREQGLPPDWYAIRARVKRRARTARMPQGRCERRLADGRRCARAGTDCDHVGDPDDHRETNLEWLCHPHHHEKTEREANAAKAAKAASRFRPGEEHPGVIT